MPFGPAPISELVLYAGNWRCGGFVHPKINLLIERQNNSRFPEGMTDKKSKNKRKNVSSLAGGEAGGGL
jgi:hypothetical protein